MSIITCAEDCNYQQEGYCQLDTAAIITNTTQKGCVHYIRKTSETKPPTLKKQTP